MRVTIETKVFESPDSPPSAHGVIVLEVVDGRTHYSRHQWVLCGCRQHYKETEPCEQFVPSTFADALGMMMVIACDNGSPFACDADDDAVPLLEQCMDFITKRETGTLGVIGF